MAFINPPRKISWILRLGIRIAEKKTKKKMEPARLLAWYPKAAVSSGIMESLVAHHEKGVSERLLKLIRMQVSFRVSCPFCIDMNSFEFEKSGISEDELSALQGKAAFAEVSTFNKKERAALQYSCEVSDTPVSIREKTVAKMKELFSDREIVIISTTIAQVNYWTRLIQSLGIRPAGFLEQCSLIRLEDYTTLKNN